MVLVVHSIAAADDSAHVNKQDEVRSGESLRGSHPKRLPLLGFSKSPSAEGGDWQAGGEGHGPVHPFKALCHQP